jgi:hypothetical protein
VVNAAAGHASGLGLRPGQTYNKCGKIGLFSLTLRPGARCEHCNCTVYLDKKKCRSQGLWRLQGRLDCRWGPLTGPGSDSEVKTDKTKGVFASCGLGPCRTWNTAWESLFKLVTHNIFQKRNNKKRKKEKKRERGRERREERERVSLTQSCRRLLGACVHVCFTSRRVSERTVCTRNVIWDATE